MKKIDFNFSKDSCKKIYNSDEFKNIFEEVTLYGSDPKKILVIPVFENLVFCKNLLSFINEYEENLKSKDLKEIQKQNPLYILCIGKEEIKE